MLDKVIAFIGSKWFILIISLGMTLAVPSTWHNVSVYPVWWTMAVFACNLAAIGLGVYKFMSMISKPKDPTQTQEWSN